MIRSLNLVIERAAGSERKSGEFGRRTGWQQRPLNALIPREQKTPGGEWRWGERPDEFAGERATGLKRGSGGDWGKPIPAAEPKDRTGMEAGNRDSEVAGQDH